MAFELDSLNPAQKEAVMTVDGPLLVLAGAGSGKTRVLTHRIAHMVDDLGVQPWQILAITFTNKAAKEMRERLGKLLERSVRGMWVCTFHAMCVRMLRSDGDRLGYTSNFTIYDDLDSKRLVKNITDALNIDVKQYPIAGIRNKISSAKNDMVSPEEYMDSVSSPEQKVAARVYAELQIRLKRANAMDFDDLLVKACELLRDNKDICESYSERFRYISIDEYQDTNGVQYKIAQLLAAKHRNLMVVGDDDQSIYSWRGADITNILNFENEYPEAKVVKLEQNYRSTGNILSAANAVVANNTGRKEKKLFTEEGAGEKVEAYLASDARDEGRWVASEIETLVRHHASYNDIAVFYRTNAQSRTLEDMFMRAGVPYKIVGGTRFFDRSEIRDVQAYLKAVVNPNDDVAILRIINTPRRGLGPASLALIQDKAAQLDISFYEACTRTLAEGQSSTRVLNALGSFINTIENARCMVGDLEKVIEAIIESSGLIAALHKESTPEAEGRIENIREFIGVVHDYVEQHENVVDTLVSNDEIGGLFDFATGDKLENPVVAEAQPQSDPLTLGSFMEWLALRSDLDNVTSDSGTVTMMTVHAAKGLEFPYVFVTAMEEGIFPHVSSFGESKELEEERRLAYVAITRAKKRLFITYASTRSLFGNTQSNPRSRFVAEIPSDVIQMSGIGSSGYEGTGWEKRGDRHATFGSGTGSDMYGGKVFGSHTTSTPGEAKPAETPAAGGAGTDDGKIVVGDRVSHKTFGPGIVVGIDGDAITINFAKTGKTKKLLMGYAPIVKIVD